MKPTFCPRKFASATLILTALWLITSQAASQQTIGVPTQVSLPSGSGTLTLDFTSSDYQLILYSALRDEPDTSRTYDFTVGAAFATRPSVRLFQHASGVRTSVKARLRSEEAELAKRFRLSGFPAARKQAVAFQVGSARTFTFESFGSVRTQNVSATLVATSSRAEAWVDNNTSLITTAEAQAQIDRFSDHAYPIITSAFGGMSDVDGNGKVIFLYTELVDQIGGVAGFFRAKSLYSTFDGGDGNEADMMYIGLDHEDSFFESLLAHEFQHLVNYNQHVRLRNGPSEISPINEALSHIAEDLVGQHVEGGNPGNVKTYAEAPGLYSILAEKAHDSGVRGTAYTFARSMMESFGDDVPRRLTQTDLSGIANVENVSAKTFEEVYETYLLRMFLAGSGLNSRYDYAYPFFVDPTTGGRSIPVPDHHALSPDAVTVTGSTKAYAAASIRLMGTEVSTISIDTDASGQFRGLLIPIPTLFRHNAALKTDYFTGITFDTSLSGHFTTGENVRISGSIADPATTEILFRFDPQDTAADTLRYSVDGLTGRFDLPVVLPHEAAGRYTLSIFAGVQDQSLPFFGRLPGVTIARGTGAVELPMDYFSAITLDATLPTELTAGSNVLVSGFVSDPTTVDRLLFRFDPLNGGDTVRIFSDVEEGRFDATFFVHPTLSGTFRIKVFAGLAADPTLGFTGDYGPFRWLDLGGVFSIPSTFFPGVSLTKDLPGILRAGEGITLAGTVSDRSVTQILFQFEPRGGGGDNLRHFLDVSGGSFEKGIVFTPAESGEYDVAVFTGEAGQSLPFISRFSFITVESTGSERVLLPVNYFPGITLDEPLQTEFFSGHKFRISGIVDLFSDGQILFRFDPDTGGEPTRFFADVKGGRFTTDISFQNSEQGTFELIVFAGSGSWSFIDAFSGAVVRQSQPAASPSTTSLSWTGIEAGTSATQGFTIRNIGSSDLIVSGTSLGTPFSINPTSATIPAGSDMSFIVSFDPQTEGSFTGKLSLTTNDPTNTAVTIELSASAIANQTPIPALVLSTSTISFNTDVGSPSTQSVTISNPGSAALEVSSITIDGPFTTSVSTATIGAGQMLSIDITFSSEDPGTFSGQITLQTNLPQKTHITLTATALTPLEPGGPGLSPDAVALPSGEVGPMGLDLDTTFGDQGLRQTPENPVAGEKIEVEVFVTEGANGEGGFLAEFTWDVQELSFSGFSAQDVFAGAVTLETPGDGKMTLSNVILGGLASKDSGSVGVATFEVAETFSGEAQITLASGKLGSNDLTIGPGAAYVVIGGNRDVSLTPQQASDFDGDGTIGFGDFLQFASGFGAAKGDANYDSRLDLDKDGSVGFSDFLSFAAVFGQPVE